MANILLLPSPNIAKNYFRKHLAAVRAVIFARQQINQRLAHLDNGLDLLRGKTNS
jgi:hypothetical protein